MALAPVTPPASASGVQAPAQRTARGACLGQDCIGTVSVVSHGHGPLLRLLLQDLAAQDGIERVLVIVTLNLPGESLAPQDHPELQLQVIANAQPLGFGANHNQAFASARGHWFAVVNPDIRLPQADTLVRLMSDRPGGGACRAPVVVGPRGLPEDSVRRNLSPWSLVRRAVGLDRLPLPTAIGSTATDGFFWVAGMFVVVQAEAYAAIGGFDQRFFMYCEDYDLCARLHAAGHAIELVRTVQVVHDARRDSRRSRAHLRWHIQSLLRVWCSAAYWRVTLQPRSRPRSPASGS